MSQPLVGELRRALSDPRAVCTALKLGVRPSDRKGPPLRPLVRCPRHGGVSCSITRGRDGTLRVHCFGCDLTGDVFHLVAEVLGLDVRRDFRDVLRACAELARRDDLVRELNPHTDRPPERRRTMRQTEETATGFPPEAEVRGLWERAVACSDDVEVGQLLASRGLRASSVDALDLARAIPVDEPVPRWARFRGDRDRSVPWTESGHRLLLPVHDARGRIRSLRAWCVRTSSDPKRLPPAGFRASGLVLACPRAVALLAHAPEPTGEAPIVITEGEPDFLTWATRFSEASESAPAILGVVSGSWNDDLASRIPNGARVILRTHHDPAGDGYARAIRESLEHRCRVLRAGRSR